MNGYWPHLILVIEQKEMVWQETGQNLISQQIGAVAAGYKSGG